MRRMTSSAEGVSELNDLAIDARVIVSDAGIREVVEAIFGANGAGGRAVELEAGSDREGEIGGAGVRDGDGTRGEHVAPQEGEEWLDGVAREEIELESDGRKALAEGPLALIAGEGDGVGISDALIHGGEGF